MHRSGGSGKNWAGAGVPCSQKRKGTSRAVHLRRMLLLPFPKPPKTELGDVGVKVFTCYEQLKEKGEKYGLSQRESEIAWMLYKGYTNRQIAEELFIAESTVKKHATHIYEKLQVAGRKEFKKKIVE